MCIVCCSRKIGSVSWMMNTKHVSSSSIQCMYRCVRAVLVLLIIASLATDYCYYFTVQQYILIIWLTSFVAHTIGDPMLMILFQLRMRDYCKIDAICCYPFWCLTINFYARENNNFVAIIWSGEIEQKNHRQHEDLLQNR